MIDPRLLTLHIATDHAGFSLKTEIVAWLKGEGYTVVDHGAHLLDEGDDFPDFIAKAARAVSQNATESRGIIFGGSGQGEAMVANRFSQVRAVVYYGSNEEIVKLSRQHNDANVLSVGASLVSVEETKRALVLWLEEPFQADPKYERRNQKIERLLK